jgi:hypothetical protein
MNRLAFSHIYLSLSLSPISQKTTSYNGTKNHEKGAFRWKGYILKHVNHRTFFYSTESITGLDI